MNMNKIAFLATSDPKPKLYETLEEAEKDGRRITRIHLRVHGVFNPEPKMEIYFYE